MPLALLAAMPPIIAASIEAGSGPILRPSGASLRLAAAPITPGCRVIDAPSAATSMPAPAVAEHDEDRVADRLAREAGAGGAEGHRRAAAGRSSEHAAKLGLVVDDDDELGNQR